FSAGRDRRPCRSALLRGCRGWISILRIRRHLPLRLLRRSAYSSRRLRTLPRSGLFLGRRLLVPCRSALGLGGRILGTSAVCRCPVGRTAILRRPLLPGTLASLTASPKLVQC